MWALAAALQADSLHVGFRRVGQKPLADLGGSGEANRIDVHVAPQGFTGLVAESGDDLEGTVGNTRLGGQRCNLQRRQAGLLGGLQDQGIACAQRRADLPAGDDQGVVPRHYRRDHAHRLPVDHAHAGRSIRGGLAVELVEGLGVVAQTTDQPRDIDAGGLRDGFAGLEGLEQGNFVGVLLDQLCPAQQTSLALGGWQVAPGPRIEGVTGNRDGTIDVFCLAGGDGDEGFAGGGILGGEGRSTGRVTELTAQVGLVRQAQATGQLLPVGQ